MGGLLFQAFIYLCAAVIAVPIAKRLGLGSVLGYLLAGIVIGPVFGLVGSETREIQHFAEFGVVMMLFLVGLEVQPRMLWQMRNRLLGLGGLQVVATVGAIMAIALLLGMTWQVALTIGLIFSLSSTAIVLQSLNEKGLSKTEGGRASFSVLLFQDIAVIPMLALIPLLAVPELVGGGAESIGGHGVDGTGDAPHADLSLVAGLPGWAHALVVLGAVAAVLLGGHYLSRPMFRFIAASRLREIFTATALLLVIGIGLLMTLVDLSPALGTFLAGVVLANSEFRHELESDIEPFKGLLLGLFFITVGAGIDFDILFGDFAIVIGLTLGVIVVKGLVLYALARLFRLDIADRWLFTLALAQAGEFGFVLLSFSLQNQALPPELAATLSLVVALSMLLTPGLFILYDLFVLRRSEGSSERQAEQFADTGTVIIAGIGRFGQIVNRLLVASGVKTVVLDHEAEMIDMLGKFGVKSYYGDASRPDLLHAAGIDGATAIVIAIDDRERSVEMVEHVRRNHPDVTILARAFDVNHLYLLNKAGVDVAVREMFDASLELGKEALKAIGMHPFKVERMSQVFRRHDQAGIDSLYELWDENIEVSSNKAYLSRAREHRATLKNLMETDRLQLHDRSERGWTPPPKHLAEHADD
ncbi:MAG: monovalent cation:proton antiporter-2 (CPA2) family protein [Gammaproteobacteria bacterium]|nr:monovalent cation:proton antiporter-2 (CPA2) family protein [Gammaproteobacteria bacterium]